MKKSRSKATSLIALIVLNKLIIGIVVLLICYATKVYMHAFKNRGWRWSQGYLEVEYEMEGEGEGVGEGDDEGEGEGEGEC